MWESPQSCESVNKFNSPYYQHQVHLILLEMSVDHFAFSVGTVQDFQNLHKRILFVNEHNILIKESTIVHAKLVRWSMICGMVTNRP